MELTAAWRSIVGAMGRAGMHTASDGLPARVAPSWTEEKLIILESYLGAFADATKRAGGWYALDMFAGPGLNWSEMRNRPRDSSPIIALKAGSPEAIEVVAAESYPKSFQALRARTAQYGDRIRLFNGDANAIVADMLAPIPKKAPTFAFLDPEGSELDWQTIKAVADHKRGHSPNKIEQLILFPTDTGFMRLTPDYPDKVTRIFGHKDWRPIYERRLSKEITADQARTEYVALYADGLRKLGYTTVLDRQITKGNGQPMYFLIFATDHKAGEKIMDHCFDQSRVRIVEELGQIQMFAVKEAPRRKRLDS
jgi:three-Cys-motif partner protein